MGDKMKGVNMGDKMKGVNMGAKKKAMVRKWLPIWFPLICLAMNYLMEYLRK